MWLTDDEFSAMRDDTRSVPSPKTRAALVEANDRIREWIGDANYNEVKDATDNSSPKVRALRFAERWLAESILARALLGQARSGGYIRRETSTDGQMTVEYRAPEEVLLMAEQYLSDARAWALPYFKPEEAEEAASAIERQTSGSVRVRVAW